jgi:hypothetical protein
MVSNSYFIFVLLCFCLASPRRLVSAAYTEDYTGYMAMGPNGNIYFPRQSIFTIRDITPWKYYIYLYLHKFSPDGQQIFEELIKDPLLVGWTQDANGNIYTATAVNLVCGILDNGGCAPTAIEFTMFNTSGGIVWSTVLPNTPMNMEGWAQLQRDPSTGDLLFGCQISDYNSSQPTQTLSYTYTVWYRIAADGSAITNMRQFGTTNCVTVFYGLNTDQLGSIYIYGGVFLPSYCAVPGSNCNFTSLCNSFVEPYLTAPLSSPSGANFFLIKYSAAGTWQWIEQWNVSSDASPGAIISYTSPVAPYATYIWTADFVFNNTDHSTIVLRQFDSTGTLIQTNNLYLYNSYDYDIGAIQINSLYNTFYILTNNVVTSSLFYTGPLSSTLYTYTIFNNTLTWLANLPYEGDALMITPDLAFLYVTGRYYEPSYVQLGSVGPCDSANYWSRVLIAKLLALNGTQIWRYDIPNYQQCPLTAYAWAIIYSTFGGLLIFVVSLIIFGTQFYSKSVIKGTEPKVCGCNIRHTRLAWMSFAVITLLCSVMTLFSMLTSADLNPAVPNCNRFGSICRGITYFTLSAFLLSLVDFIKGVWHVRKHTPLRSNGFYLLGTFLTMFAYLIYVICWFLLMTPLALYVWLLFSLFVIIRQILVLYLIVKELLPITETKAEFAWEVVGYICNCLLLGIAMQCFVLIYII